VIRAVAHYNIGVDPNATDLALLVLRLAVGLTVVAHGVNHIKGPGGIAGTGGWFESMGLRPGHLHAWMASVTELAGGVLLALGLATPLGAAAVVGVMVVAGITAHRTNGFFIFRPGQGWEYVMVLAVAALALAALGPGRWSLDHLAGWDTGGWTGLAIAVVAGIGGGAALLAVYWRPKPAAT
jgi:putative oxidoreductase